MTVVPEPKQLKGLGHFYMNAKMVESPSLEVLKIHVDRALEDMYGLVVNMVVVLG